MKKYYITIIISILILTSAILLFIYPREKPHLIIVGTEYPPYEFTKNGEVIGITIDFIDKIFSEMDVTYEIKLMDWSDALNEMSLGNADAILDVGHHESRENFIDFSQEHLDFYTTGKLPTDIYWPEGLIFFHKTDLEIDVESYEDIRNNNLRFGIINDYVYENRNEFEGLNSFAYDNSEQLFNALNEGEIDIIIAPYTEGLGIIAKNDWGDIITNSDEIFYSDYIIPFAFSKISTTKDLSKIKTKYLKEFQKLKDMNYHYELFEKYIGYDLKNTKVTNFNSF